jgi:hypothetical protein
MAHFLPFKEDGFTSEHLAKMFRFIFRLHGIPEDIVSDRGPIFTSKFWRAFTSGLGIKLNFSTAFHPQTDGQTERVNQVLEQYLRMFVNYQQDNWSELLYKAEFTYNNTEHASTKMTPFYANLGHHPLDPSVPFPDTGNPAAQTHLQKLEAIRPTLVENLHKAQADYAKFYNRKVKTHLDLADQPLYSVGDKVWLNSRDITTSRPAKKLDHKLLGPFEIIEKISDLAYRLDLPATMDVNNTFHVSKLEPFKEGHPGQPQQESPEIIIEGERVVTSLNGFSMADLTLRQTGTCTLYTGKATPTLKTLGSLMKNSSILPLSTDFTKRTSTNETCSRLPELCKATKDNPVQEAQGLRPKPGGAVMNDRTKYSTIDCSKTFSRLWPSMIQRSAKTCSCVLSVCGSVPHITALHHTTPHNTTHHPTPWQQHHRTLCSCRIAQRGVSPAGC